jgi:CHAD domain-containing protein
MAGYRWQPDASPREELRRIARDQVERGLGELDDADRHAVVHQIRKRGKKVRALLRLVRATAPELYERENAAFRNSTRRLAADRDAAVGLETYDELRAHFDDAYVADDASDPVRAALVERRETVEGDDLEERLAAVRADLETALERIEAWEVDGEGFDVVAGGLAKTYGRARARMEDAYDEPSSEAFHEWRKRVKYHRYQVRLLQDAWPKVMKARRKQLHELSDLLGDDHDLAVLRDDLVADPDRYGGEDAVATVYALLDRRRAELQAHARSLGMRCFAEPADHFVDRVEAYWQVATCPDTSGPLADATVPSGR